MNALCGAQFRNDNIEFFFNVDHNIGCKEIIMIMF